MCKVLRVYTYMNYLLPKYTLKPNLKPIFFWNLTILINPHFGLGFNFSFYIFLSNMSKVSVQLLFQTFNNCLRLWLLWFSIVECFSSFERQHTTFFNHYWLMMMLQMAIEELVKCYYVFSNLQQSFIFGMVVVFYY